MFRKRITVIASERKSLNFISGLVEYSEGYQLEGGFLIEPELTGKLKGASPQIVVVSVGYTRSVICELVAGLRTILPATEILLFSPFLDAKTAMAAFAAGANGYLPPDAIKDLYQYLHELSIGATPLDGRITREIIKGLEPEQHVSLKGNEGFHPDFITSYKISSEIRKTRIRSSHRKPVTSNQS